MSSTFSGSTFSSSSFDNNTDLVHQKKTSLLDKVIQKRSDLGFSSANLTGRNVEALDADTVRINPSVADKAFDPMVKPVDIRLKSNNFGESFNSYEVNHGNESDPEVAARLSKQRGTIDNELLHGWFNPATNQDIYDRGEKAKQILSNKLKAVNEGKTGLDFALGEKDVYGRSLGDMKFSNENNSAIDAMNTPELNSSYNTSYNFAKQNKDTATIGQALEDTGRLALTGIEGIGSTVGYGLEKTGIAPELGRQIQDEHFKHDEMLRSHLSDPVRKASQEPLLNTNNDLNPSFGWTSLAANVIPSIPGSVVMGGAGGALAKALGVGAKAALGAETTASKLITNGLGYGTSEGVFSAAQNADQWGQEQRLKPINEFKKSPLWNETLAKNDGDEEATKEDLINQGQSDIFNSTAVTTGVLSGLPGMAGGMYGELFKSAGSKITAKQALINSLKGMGEEALQEYPQSLFERRTTNQATKDYIDPNQDVSEGQWNDAAIGGLSGFAMGAMGAGGHIASIDRTKIPVDTQTPTKENIVQSEANLKPSIEDYQASVDNITDDNRQEVINQGIKDFPVNGTLAEKQQMANAIGKALNGEQSPEFNSIAASIFAETTLQNVVAQMNKDNPTGFSDVINDPNTTIEDIQDSIITATTDSVSTNTGSLFNDIGRTKDKDTLNILKGISTAKQKEYAESNTVNDPYVLATTGIETKYLPKESSEVFSSITRNEYANLNQGLNLLSAHVKSATTPEQKNTGISALTKTISKIYSDKVDITPATEKTVKQALNTINGLVTNKGTITIDPNDSLEQIHNKILPTFGSQPIKGSSKNPAIQAFIKANNAIVKSTNILTKYLNDRTTGEVHQDIIEGGGEKLSALDHARIITALIVDPNVTQKTVDKAIAKYTTWLNFHEQKAALATALGAIPASNKKAQKVIEDQLEALQGQDTFKQFRSKSLVYTSGLSELAKGMDAEVYFLQNVLKDINDLKNTRYGTTPQVTPTQSGKGLVTKTTSAKIQASKSKVTSTTQSTSQTNENALDSTNVNQEDTIEEINMDDIPEKSITTKEPSFDEEQERIYQEYVDSQIQQQEAQEDKTTVIEDLNDSNPILKELSNILNGTDPINNVLDYISKSESKFNKLAAFIKTKISKDLSLVIGSAEDTNRGTYFHNSKIIHLNPKHKDYTSSKSGHALLVRTILHELVHSITQEYLEPGSAFANRLNNILDILEKEADKDGWITKGKYSFNINRLNTEGVSDPSELLTYSLFENNLTNILQEIPFNQNKSLWDRLVSILSNVMGLPVKENTLLAEVLTIFTEITSPLEDEFKTPIKQDFTPEYQKEIKEFKLVNVAKLKKGILSLKPIKRTIPNPISQMFSFDKVKDSLFGKYPRLFENLFNLPEFTVNTKDGLKAFETLKKEETKFQEAFKKSYLEKPFEDDPLIVLANQNVANGKFDPNIVSAMFMGSIDWLMNKGSDTLFNFEKDIQSILSMDENTIPQNEISNALSELGSIRTVVATGLGNNIFNLIKFTASKTYPENEIAKLKLSLGLHALNTLNNMGYVTYSAVENSTFDKFKQNEVVNPEVKGNLKPSELQDQSVVFVRIASDIEDKKSVIEYDLKQVLDTLKAGNKEITTMFESAYEKELPRTRKPNKASVLASLGFNEEKGKKATGLHTTQEITSERIDALTEYVQTPHTLDTPTMKLLLAMDKDAMAEMELGVDFQEQKQQSKERSYRGKVLSYEKEKEALEKLLELSEQGSKPLYFMSTFWNQGRIGGIGVGHPQNNKWIRNLSSPKNYFVKIKPSDEFAVTQFKLAVLEAFGVAAKSLTKEQINPKFQEILEANQKAIDEINKQKEGKEFNQRTIINAVHKGKEKAHTLNGLVALSMYSPTEEFETNIGREVDGITNGVLIGLVLLAGVDNFERMKDVLAAAGLFEDPTMDYATWKNSVESKEDNYEQIARVFATSLNQAEQTPQLLAIKHFIGDLLVDDKVTKAGRNFAKPILLLTMFGKSTDKLANSVGDTVIATFYDELEKLFRDTDLQPEEKEAKLEILKTQIQTILGTSKLQGNWYVDGKVVRGEDNKASVVDLTMNNLLEFSLTQQDTNSIIATVNHLFQPMIEEAINHNFGVTIANRKILNDAYFVVGEVFKLGLQKELLRFQYEQYIKLHPDNLHPTRKQLEHFRANEGKEPSAEQMDKIIADLIKIQPRSPTKNSESLEQNLQLWNSERSSNHTAAYKTQTGWNSKTGKLTYQIADENGRIFTQELDLPKSTSAHALSLIVNSLGVGVTIANIHNRDSNVMIDMMKSKFKGLAVHDAFIFNLLEAVEGSKLLNSSLIDSLNSFDVFQGAVDNLERVQEYLKANPDILSELNSSFTSPTQGLFSKQRFYTKDKKTKKITPHYNNLDNFVERLKANQETLATQRQEQIWDHIPKGGVKQYGGQDSYEFTEEVKPSTTQTNKDKLIILPIGTSGSGKSTWIKSLKGEYVIISPDEMRVEFTGNMDDKTRDKDIYEAVKERTIKAINQGKQVIIDSTNLQRDRRRDFINTILQAIPDANIVYKLLPLNPELAKQRIKAQIDKGENRANVPDSTIDRHAKLYKEMLKDIKDEPITEFKEQTNEDNKPLGSTTFKKLTDALGYYLTEDTIDASNALFEEFTKIENLKEGYFGSDEEYVAGESYTAPTFFNILLNAIPKELPQHVLLKNILNTQKNIIKNITVEIGNTGEGVIAIGRQGNIKLSPKYVNDLKEELDNGNLLNTTANIYSVLTHELLHALVHEKLNDGIEENKESEFSKKLKLLYEEAKTQSTSKELDMYGFENLDEFVSEAFSNVPFQKVLLSKKVSKDTQMKLGLLNIQSLFDAFVHLLADTFGINKEDKDILSTVLELVNAEVLNKKDNTLGSTPNAKDLLTDVEDLKKDITKENIVSEFDAMPKGDDEKHNTFLRNFVSQVIAPVVEATELLLFNKATYTYGQYSAELKKVAINLGQALQEQYSPFKMSAQEVFAHEFSHAVTWAAYQMPKNGTLKRKIDSLFYAVRREFNKAKVLDPSLAKWDYVFNNTDPIKVDNAPNSLGEVTTTSYDRGIQEFIAFGTTNKEFRDLIKRLQPKQLKVNQVYEGTGSNVIKEASWLETITNVFKKVLDSFMRIAKGNDYLEPLTQFDTNVRLILAANTDKPFVNITAITDKVEAEVAKKTNEGFKKGLRFIAKGRNSKVQFIRSAAKIVDEPYIGAFQTNQVVRQTLKLITNPTARQFALDLVKDTVDVNENSKPIVNVNLQQRTADADRNKATDSDENNWSKRVTLNHEQDIAYNNVLVRGDYESLNDAYGDDAIKLLKDKSFRDKQIKLIGDQISNLKSKSLNLANLMVRGKNMFNGMTEHNAVLIAKQGRNIPQDKYQKEIDLVTKLSRLYAIGLQDENQLNQVISLLESNPEGMKQMLMVHKELKKQQLTEIDALTVIDGKTHTTLDPNKTIFLGTKEDEKHLVSDWKAKVIGKLERDPNDPLSTEGILYLVNVKMQNDWDAKAMATTDITPGSSNFQSGIVKTDRFKAAENREKAKLKEDGTKTKNHIFTRNNSNVSRVAIHNAQGQIIRYEYILDRETQEKYLNPRINVLRDLAAQKNGTTYRYKAYELNHKLVDALYDYWKKLGHAAKKDMIWIGSDSKYKDLYNTIPTETKEYITKVFGTENGFYMAEEELREVFGYRKQSITNWIQPVQADELKKTMGNMIYEQAKRFGLNQANIKALETMWIEGIAIAKDTIVVKSGVVSAANESSNFMTAKLAGVPVGFYYKNKISAMKAEQEYRRDSHAYLSHLSNAYGNPDYITKEIAAEMKILETALSQNEMSYLHDEGLASTVAEEGSYKDKHQTMLYNKTERARNIFDKLPKVVKDTLKVSSIAEGTKIYKLLDEIAQMGDITSRHVLVKWEEEKATQQGKTFDQNKAIDLAKFLFIQYHTVTNDLVQYGNDIGLLMFTKFAVKALKVLTYMVGHHPARLIALGLFEEMFTTTHWIWDTSWNKFSNGISTMMATIDASPVINFTLTPPAYMDDRVFGALDAVLPV